MKHLIFALFLCGSFGKSLSAQEKTDSVCIPPGLSTLFIDEPDTIFWNFDLDPDEASRWADRYLAAFQVARTVHPMGSPDASEFEFSRYESQFDHPYDEEFVYRTYDDFDITGVPNQDFSWAQILVDIEPYVYDERSVSGELRFYVSWRDGKCESATVSSGQTFYTLDEDGDWLQHFIPVEDFGVLQLDLVRYLEIFEKFMGIKGR